MHLQICIVCHHCIARTATSLSTPCLSVTHCFTLPYRALLARLAIGIAVLASLGLLWAVTAVCQDHFGVVSPPG